MKHKGLTEPQDFTFDDVSLTKVETLENQIATLTLDEAATEGALAAAKAALACLETRLDSARLAADGATSRLADARNATTSVLGAVRIGHAASKGAVDIRSAVKDLLESAHQASELALNAAAAVDDLVAEVATYGKNHYLPQSIADGVSQAERSAKAFVASAIESVEAAMAAFLASSVAQGSAEAVHRQGVELWNQLDATSDPLAVRGVSHLKLGRGDVQGMAPLATAVWSSSYPAGVLHVLADSQSVQQQDELELNAAVTQARLEVNTLDQRQATQKAALRAAQLALDGARAALGTRF